MKLIQISDTHFGTEQPPVVEALLELVTEAAPDLVVMSGDITQRARRDEFDRARAFVDRLPVQRVMVIPGNHDIPLYNLPARLFAPYGGFSRVFGEELEPSHDTDDALIITVRTTRRYRHVDGEVSRAQIEAVAARLRKARDSQLRIVVTHQPVCVQRPQDEVDLLHGHKAAIAGWSAAGADIIMGGHIHLPYVCPLHETNVRLPRKIWAVQAGTATSWRVRNEVGNSINIVHYDSGGVCSVERWDFRPAESRFRQAVRHELHLDESRIYKSIHE
ncbi:metallophosphoesterase [Iodidimonas sp. SYSU 1G8]|uniref:metallophosphoesterase family protein n=1 Tax=Iodidimonas sp. SYSU 1G8 TaxID=3133967 RepID=UPI0031FE7F92